MEHKKSIGPCRSLLYLLTPVSYFPEDGHPEKQVPGDSSVPQRANGAGGDQKGDEAATEGSREVEVGRGESSRWFVVDVVQMM